MLLLRNDLSLIHANFGMGDPYDSASIMVEDIVQWLEAPDQENNQHALYISGCCYQYGVHWEIDSRKGLNCIRKAADLGHASAQCRLGYAYNSGTDVEQDRSVAFE